MDLKHATLCIDCEWVYEQRTACPRCGSHVAFPISRALAPSPAPNEARLAFQQPRALASAANLTEFYRPVSAPVPAYLHAPLAATA